MGLSSKIVSDVLGALMGACAVLLGVYMLLRMRRIANTADRRREQKALSRMMEKHFPDYALTAVEKGFTEQGMEVVSVRLLTGIPPEAWEQVRAETERRCRFRLENTDA